MSDAFGRPAMWLGDSFQIVWVGRWWWVPFMGFARVPANNPMATVWVWQFFLGPIEIRRWVDDV